MRATKTEKPNKCFCEEHPKCQGRIKVTSENYKIKSEGRTILVPEVEVWVCQKCGDKFYPAESSKKIDGYRFCSGKFSLRMDPPTHWALLHIAKSHRRSVNQELNQIIDEYLEKHPIEKSA